jgi:signal transduction histidine kinase
VIAISAAAENFDAFELALLMHEVEVVAIGVERMFSRQRLERQVETRTRELRDANAALATALNSLQQTQKELFQAEKMAAMGRLVASVAHELNTPLGNCLMSASTIETELTNVRAALARGAIRRSELDHFVGAVAEGCSLLHQGLASMTNFRKASSPHASALRLHFDFRQLLRQIVTTLRQRYAGAPVEFLPVADETAPDPLMLNGFPDALSDVLYELAQNAVEHGLAGRTGHVWLAWRLAGQTLVIRVEDDGCGVPEDSLDRLFDPFYNSRMGRSLGLGLSTVHNTVGGLLGGKISAEARREGGTVMRMALPLTAPD